MLEMLSKLLNQAENAATEAEAEAFFAKAQELATLHAISLAEARAHAANSQRREQPTHEQITIGQPRQHVNSHLCLLSAAIGEANSLRTNVAANNTYIIWFGLPSDIEKATLLLHSIAHQMVRTADAFIRGRSWENDRDPHRGGRITPQKARKSYYTAYVHTISERLAAARRSAEHEYDRRTSAESAALVLRGKEVEVRQYYEQTSTARGVWRGDRRSVASATAVGAGRSDAGKARLESSRQIGGSQPAVAS